MTRGHVGTDLTGSRNPGGRERLRALAESPKEPSIAEEIRLHRSLCTGMLCLLAVVLGAHFLF